MIFLKHGGFKKFFNPTVKYFHKIEQEESYVEEAIRELEKIKDTFKNDNITLQLEMDKLKNVIDKINQEYEKGNELKTKVMHVIEKAKEEGIEENKIIRYRENVLIPLDKRVFDLKQMSIVNEQSYLGLEMIIRNNKEIIRNIERIKNVTMVAFRTAVLVAKSINHQQIVLKKMNTLEGHAENVITGANSVFSLKQSFRNVYDVLEEVSDETKETIPEIETKMIEIARTK